jgi:hypothetical protein
MPCLRSNYPEKRLPPLEIEHSRYRAAHEGGSELSVQGRGRVLRLCWSIATKLVRDDEAGNSTNYPADYAGPEPKVLFGHVSYHANHPGKYAAENRTGDGCCQGYQNGGDFHRCVLPKIVATVN